MSIESFDSHLQERLSQLKAAKDKGTKVIGYFPGNYVPEELIIAAGAIPLCLASGGDALPLQASLATIPDVFCPFARTQVGEKLLKRNPYYDIIDMFIAPVTCQHLKKVAEIWEYYGDIEIFKLGIPHQYNNDFEITYYADRLRALKERLQKLTGNTISDSKLLKSIELYNQIRELLKKISYSRTSPSTVLNSIDFIKLNHASLQADPEFMVGQLKVFYDEIKSRQSSPDLNRSRLLLIGPNIGYGDYDILKLTDDLGGNIVIEEIFEGMRYYWESIDADGNPIDSLARGYLLRKVPPAFLRFSAKRRLEFVLKLISDFRVAGIIWNEMLCCETYDAESYFFSQKMKEYKIPVLVLESDYGMANKGQTRTRIEAFLEMVKGGLK